MSYFKIAKKYKPKKAILNYFLKQYWFIPSDVLQRSMEANIWDLCTFKPPVLEIGIGNGKLTNFLLRNHPTIDVGIDIDKKGIESAKQTKNYKKVLIANAEKMPFKNNTFSTVISNSTFEHIANDFLAISEVSRVLKKDGLFFLTVPSNFLQDWILEHEKEKNPKTANGHLKRFNKRTAHLHYHSLEEWKKQFSSCNLEVLIAKYYFPKYVALYWYKLFTIFTKTFRGKELWSYLIHSRIAKFIPQKFIAYFLIQPMLKKKYESGFFTENKPGAQIFIVGKKI